MRFLLSQSKLFFTNRAGLICVFANLILVVWGLSEKGWYCCNFHFTYEPFAIKILTFLNLPALIFSAFIYEWLFSTPENNWSMVVIYDFEMVLIVVFSIFQWLFIGHFLNRLFRLNREKIK